MYDLSIVDIRYILKFTVGTTRRIVSLHCALSARQLYSRDHILRFNLSIVPGITEFRRKNNAYCGTHKAVGYKTLMSGQANGAQARTTCIFMSTTRSVRGFFPGLVSLRVGPRNVRHTHTHIRARAHIIHTCIHIYCAITGKHYNL